MRRRRRRVFWSHVGRVAASSRASLRRNALHEMLRDGWWERPDIESYRAHRSGRHRGSCKAPVVSKIGTRRRAPGFGRHPPDGDIQRARSYRFRLRGAARFGAAWGCFGQCLYGLPTALAVRQPMIVLQHRAQRLMHVLAGYVVETFIGINNIDDREHHAA
jgi:hypothetical protein